MTKRSRYKTNEYIATVKCSNCGVIQSISIPIGIKVEKVIKSRKCKNCFCPTVEKVGK